MRCDSGSFETELEKAKDAFTTLVVVVDTDDLIDPTDEGRDLDVDGGHVWPA